MSEKFLRAVPNTEQAPKTRPTDPVETFLVDSIPESANDNRPSEVLVANEKVAKPTLEDLERQLIVLREQGVDSPQLAEAEETLAYYKNLHRSHLEGYNYDSDLLVQARKEDIFDRVHGHHLENVAKIFSEQASTPLTVDTLDSVAPVVLKEPEPEPESVPSATSVESFRAPKDQVEKQVKDYLAAAEKYAHDLSLLKDAETKADATFLAQVTRWLENSEKNYLQTKTKIEASGIEVREVNVETEAKIDSLHQKLGWGSREGSKERVEVAVPAYLAERVSALRETVTEAVRARAARLATVLANTRSTPSEGIPVNLAETTGVVTQEAIEDVSKPLPSETKTVSIVTGDTSATSDSTVESVPTSLITPAAVESYIQSYSGGATQWNKDYETYLRTFLPLTDQPFSSWFSIGAPKGDLVEHLSTLTVADFEELSAGSDIRSYLRPLNIPIASFRALQSKFAEIADSGKVSINLQMSVADVLKAGFVAEQTAK